MAQSTGVYLDENVNLQVAAILRAAGYDVTSAREAGMLHASDDRQLEYATSQGRVLYTQDQGDYRQLARRWAAEGRHHAGIFSSASISAPLAAAWIRTALGLFDDYTDVTLILPVPDDNTAP